LERRFSHENNREPFAKTLDHPIILRRGAVCPRNTLPM
jgi:hypothetical protein